MPKGNLLGKAALELGDSQVEVVVNKGQEARKHSAASGLIEPSEDHCQAKTIAVFGRESARILTGEEFVSKSVFGGKKTQHWKGHCSKLQLRKSGVARFSLGLGYRK